jgi:NADH:ubiquinone oxidoreductase subunit F (NADH-binding)
MAAESAGQCGPCVFGLRAIAATTQRIADGDGAPVDLADLERWTGQVVGRGACHHPDGAAQVMASALRVFGDDFVRHVRTGRCESGGGRSNVA